MTHAEAVAYWYARIDFERRAPKPGDLKLDRMRALLARLGDPHAAVPCAHVTGTKGKGSTSAMLAAILRAAGRRVGLFTSPHLARVEERVRVDGAPIREADLAARLAEMRPHVEALTAAGDPPTFFEVGTAMAMLHFARAGVEVAVYEVGLGGRFDSTNVVDPLVSVVTNVSLDHTVMLGNTVPLIAFEKAGILKPGRPAVCAADDPEAIAVVRRVARERGCPLSVLGEDFFVSYTPGRLGGPPPRARVVTATRDWGEVALGLWGAHQARNAAAAVRAAECLRGAGIDVPDAAIADGLANVQWPARLEVVAREPWGILDCAHNVASAAALVAALDEVLPAGTRRHLLFAASLDKDIPGMLRVLAPAFDAFTLARYTCNPRAASVEQLRDWLAPLAGDKPVALEPDPPRAWTAARAALGPAGALVAAGSVFLAGELRPLLVPPE